jgi:quercetin dioxygenase-like cupin family protein
MPFSQRSTGVGVTAGPRHGLRRLVILVQPVAPDEVAFLHRHDGDQVLTVLEGEVLVEVASESRICRHGDVAVAPARAAHGFRGVGVRALLEVFGEQRCGTEFLLRDGSAVEVHRPGVPWDRPGAWSDMDAIAAQALEPQLP